jgi:ribose-phosphate pyrophosphokinase
MGDWLVVPGPASQELAKKIGEQIEASVINIESKIFADGESKITFSDNVRNKRVILVQSTYPPVDRHIFQTLLLAHRLSEEGAEVNTVIPYMAYSRQDREFLAGEIVSMRVIARLFRSVGIRRFVTVDIHSVEGLSNFSIPSYSVSAVPLLADYVGKHIRLENPIVASPDFGGSGRVEAFSKILNIPYLIMEKKRDRFTGEIVIKELEVEIGGHDVLILDDIISTGGSIQRASINLKESGAKKVYAICTHPVLIGDAIERIHEAGVEQIIATNTIPQIVSKVDISSSIAEHFMTLG